MNKLQERIQTVRDAAAFKKTDRIPTHSHYWTYQVLDGGYTLKEAIYDYDKLYDSITGFQKKYNFDFYNYQGNRNPFRVTDLLDANPYTFDAKGEYLNIADYKVMEADEYPALIADPKRFIWEKILSRKCGAFHTEEAYDRFQEAVVEYDRYNEAMDRIGNAMVNELQVPRNSMTGLYDIPFDFMTNQMRGLKGMCLDLRRHYSEVKEAVTALSEVLGVQAYLDSLLEPMPDDAIFGTTHVMLAHSILTVKQWGEIYWPYFEKVIENCAKTGKQVHLFTEAEVMRFAEYLEDVPKGVLMLQPEMDDVFELRKRLPNCAICGGMPPELLGRGTKEDCIEYAKKLVNELGIDGGFVMGQTKMMSYRNDAKAENILAVQEFCETYTG